jgi:ElaB/YqjD/DUF883 family membrane-anchored ribosome-binding protein
MSATQASKPATPDLDSIASDLAALKQDFASLMTDLRNGTANRARGMARDAASRIADTATNLYDQTASQAEAGIRAISEEVEERPLTALIMAFAVGFVASRMLSR